MARLPITIAGPKALAVPQLTWPVDSSAAWVRGAIVIDDGGGELTEGGTNPTLIAGVATSKTPLSNTQGASTDDGKFIPAYPGLEFEGSIDDSNDLGNGAIAAGDLGTAYGITEDSSGIWYIDKNKTAAATVRVRVTKLIDDATTVNGRVRFVFLQLVDLSGTPTATTLWLGN